MAPDHDGLEHECEGSHGDHGPYGHVSAVYKKISGTANRYRLTKSYYCEACRRINKGHWMYAK